MSTTRIPLIKAYQAAIISIAKRGTLKNSRRAVLAAERTVGKTGVYTWGNSTKADFLEYCEIRIADLVAHDHAEALILNDALDQTYPLARKVLLWAYISEEDKVRMLELAHTEALEMDKQATHFRKEQAALTQRVAAIMGRSNTPEFDTAPV